MTSEDRTKKNPWISCQVGDISVSQDSVQENKDNPAITQLGQNKQPKVKDKVEVRNQKSTASLFTRSSKEVQF